MKILFLSQRTPYPPNRGDKIRSFNILKHLAKNHEIHLCCLADDLNDSDHRKELGKYCKSVDIVFVNALSAKIRSLFALFTAIPLTLSYYYSKTLECVVNKKLKEEKFDLIFIYCSSMAQYVLQADIPKVIDFVDVDSDKWRQYAQYSSFLNRFIYNIECVRMRKYERIVTERVKHSMVTTKAEAELFKSFIPDIRLSAISNGVDYEYFKFNPEAGLAVDNKKLVFIGQMDYLPNVEGMLYFCKEILPLIKSRVPDVGLYIVGRNPVKEIIGLADEHIIVTGSVADTRPYVWGAAVCVVPLRIARGVQNKVLEAMAMGVAVVATPEAAKGISARAEDIFIEREPQQFAARVTELLGNRELRRQVAAKARETIEEKYDWDKNLRQIDGILDEI